MQNSIMTREDARAIMTALGEPDRASAFQGSTDAPFEVQVITLSSTDLGTARTDSAGPAGYMNINFAFRSVYVVSATDSNVEIQLKPNTDDSIQGSIPLRLNSGIKFPRSLAKAKIWWSAQSGKTMTLIFFTSGEFSSGRLNLINSGGINLNYGDTVTTNTAATAAAAATSILAADTARKMAIVYNFDTQAIYLGGSTVTTESGTKPGIRLVPGASYEWLSSAAIYCIADVAGVANKIGITVLS